MRAALAATLLLAACATAMPSERVNGCWVDRADAGGPSLRFTPDRNRPGILHGLLTHPGAAAKHYQLRQYVSGWSFCEIGAGGDQCWQVAQERSGSLEGGRAFIDAEAGHLRISVLGQDRERVIFEGERDACH